MSRGNSSLPVSVSLPPSGSFFLRFPASEMSDGFTRVITRFLHWLFVASASRSGPLPYFHYSYSFSIRCSRRLPDEFARVFGPAPGSIWATCIEERFDASNRVCAACKRTESIHVRPNHGGMNVNFAAAPVSPLNGAINLLPWSIDRYVLLYDDFKILEVR